MQLNTSVEMTAAGEPKRRVLAREAPAVVNRDPVYGVVQRVVRDSGYVASHQRRERSSRIIQNRLESDQIGRATYPGRQCSVSGHAASLDSVDHSSEAECVLLCRLGAIVSGLEISLNGFLWTSRIRPGLQLSQYNVQARSRIEDSRDRRCRQIIYELAVTEAHPMRIAARAKVHT